jgi:hypothetical protein
MINPFEKNQPKVNRLELTYIEKLNNIMSWRYKLFDNGHRMHEIDELSYWDLTEYSEFLYNNRPKEHGEARMKQLLPTQKKMIEERKIRTQREKNNGR